MSKRKKAGASKGHKPKSAIKQGHCEALCVQVPGDDEVQFGFAAGNLARIDQIGLKISHDDIIDGVENVERFGEIIAKVGLLVFSRLIGYNIAYGPEGMPKHFAKWAGIDLEALSKEAELIKVLEENAKIKRSASSDQVFDTSDVVPIDDDLPESMREKVPVES